MESGVLQVNGPVGIVGVSRCSSNLLRPWGVRVFVYRVALSYEGIVFPGYGLVSYRSEDSFLVVVFRVLGISNVQR